MSSSYGVWLLVWAVLNLSLAVCEEDVVASKNILVLMENVWIKETHSQFLKSLTDRGYVTTVSTADDPNLSLTKYGEYSYGHLIILAPSASEFGGKLNVREIVNFLDYGGNVIVVANSEVGEAIRELGSECGIEFDEENTHVIDHHNYDVSDDGTHTNVVVSPENLINCSVITGDVSRHPFIYRGVGISSDPNNPLLINILHASRSSYGYNIFKKITDYPNVVGTNTQLIVALQARNNARALFIGSLDFLSDKSFTTPVKSVLTGEKYPVSGNRELINNLLPWVLGERGQLRVVSLEHHRIGETDAPGQYTIMDNVYYGIRIETKNELGHWVPYDADDVQLEFFRIDPFIRRTMKHKDGLYYAHLKLPDVYGVFKFVVDYHRLGYTHLKSTTQVPVRPFTHTQYERFIEAAYPYYFSAISMIIGLVMFSFVFLYYKDDKEKME
ncbi:Dolichyl-diphosphooligosaccharide--protein glycosyltransferase non-catalytic subunit [Paragonimus heterotremus]|uniref:Dolichyl-diphosphooligosaccharide--protein glycosyltransferase 48 kDa subunit n=1 Tax=Paragonimus heterotremus TaxID=100268 RepID=A0A8J4SYM7_9TREM|nr:Dolichyl-diphosphooligosaccharide--protein glycosyltransferase non-catalytic subunit [Paragonimus heterotremus]